MKNKTKHFYLISNNWL